MKSRQQTKVVKQRKTALGLSLLPQSLLKAAGLLRHKRKSLKQHQRRVRKEWHTKA